MPEPNKLSDVPQDFNWKTSKWSTKYFGKTPVYDLMLDYDGCFIATTKDGITVNKEKTDMYFKFVCAPFLFFFPV